MRIGLVPLDDRPRSSRAPGLLARVAGAQLVLPPAGAVGGCQVGQPQRLAEWLRDEAPRLDALVVSVDQLAAGGAAHGPDTGVGEAVGRLTVLPDLRRDCPQLTVHAWTCLAGAPGPAAGPPPEQRRHADALRLGDELLDGVGDGAAAADLAAARSAVPEEVRRGAGLRRLRVHAVNLAALELAATGTVEHLALATGGAGAGRALERAWVVDWLRRLDPGTAAQLQPGVDEVAGVLVGRILHHDSGRSPRVGFFCPQPGAEKRTAPDEEASAARVVLRQIRALGAELVDSDADVVLTLLPPAGGDVSADLHSSNEADDAAALLADEVTRLQALGVPPAIADVAHRHGGDSRLVERMRSRVNLTALGGYAAGGTAGDAVGAALTQGSLLPAAKTEEARAAHELCVLHRLLDDGAFQGKLRGRLRRRLTAETGTQEPLPEALASVQAQLERDLSVALAQLPRFAGRYRIVPGSVRLPWGLSFDCDFELERIDVPPGRRRSQDAK